MKYIAVAALLVAVVVAMAAFVIVTNDPDDKKECDIVVTMGWEKEIVDTLTQKGLNTVVLMEENTSPHASYSTTSSIEYLYNAKLFIEIGSGVEWEESMLSGVSGSISTPTISCMDLIEEAHGHEGGEHAHDEHDHDEAEHDHDEAEHDEDEHAGHNHESHIWVNPEQLEFVAEGLAEVLKERFPDVADKIDDGLETYMGKLNHTVGVIERIIDAKAAGQTIFVWHNAWGPMMEYFNEVATETTGITYTTDSPFMYITSGEAAGSGDTPTTGTISYMNSVKGLNKTVYVSPFDTASQYKNVFEDGGFTVVEINPTSGQFLSELDKFMHSLEHVLVNA